VEGTIQINSKRIWEGGTCAKSLSASKTETPLFNIIEPGPFIVKTDIVEILEDIYDLIVRDGHTFNHRMLMECQFTGFDKSSCSQNTEDIAAEKNR
jgi:hypothetical protein